MDVSESVIREMEVWMKAHAACSHLWKAAAASELVQQEDAVSEHLGALVALDHEQRHST